MRPSQSMRIGRRSIRSGARWRSEYSMRSSHLPRLIDRRDTYYCIARDESRKCDLCICRYRFVFFCHRAGLALFVLLCFFELLGEVALAVTVEGWVVPVYAELVCYHFFIDLIVGTQAQAHHTLSQYSEGQYYGYKFPHR